MVVARRSLGKPIVNAPAGGNAPWLNGIVGASNLELAVQGFASIFGDVGPRWLNRAQFICAARHKHAFFPEETYLRHSAIDHYRPSKRILARRPDIGPACNCQRKQLSFGRNALHRELWSFQSRPRQTAVGIRRSRMSHRHSLGKRREYSDAERLDPPSAAAGWRPKYKSAEAI